MPQVDLKVVLLGDMAVGKTCLSERFANDRFAESVSFQNVICNTDGSPMSANRYLIQSSCRLFGQKTIGTAFVSRQIEVDNKKLILGIWDTAGCERYEAMTKLYYRGAQAAIICYDITNPKSFAKAKYWVREVRSVEEGCKIYICATKKDLLEEIGEATPNIETVENYAAGVQLKFYITSSKTGENVAELFQDIARHYAPTIDKQNPREWGNGFISLSTDNKKSTCCPLGGRN